MSRSEAGDWVSSTWMEQVTKSGPGPNTSDPASISRNPAPGAAIVVVSTVPLTPASAVASSLAKATRAIPLGARPATVAAVPAFAALGTCASVLSLTFAPVTALFSIFAPVTAPFLSLDPVTAPRAMSEFLTEPFFKSSELTVFFPGSATAVPDRAASSATKARTSAGEGRRLVNGMRMSRPPQREV